MFDIAIIGGGLVGLATAWTCAQKFPSKKIVLIEKESDVAMHQSGRNSGVLHSGVYYKPGSMKAKNCIHGKYMLEKFCTEYGVPWKKCGKVIVASSDADLSRLKQLNENGAANGVRCRLISPKELVEIEPAVVANSALYVADTGVVDFSKVAAVLLSLLRESGVEIRLGFELKNVEQRSHFILTARQDEIAAKTVVNCAGLHSDRILALWGSKIAQKIIPFRGEYYYLKPDKAHLCQGLIYPVPNPAFPFLGIHFSRDTHGHVDCGPSSVLAFAREGYTLGSISPGDLLETFSFVGFWKLLAAYPGFAAAELHRSFSKAAFVRQAKKLIPEVDVNDFEAAPAGVRAQAVDYRGNLLSDFLIHSVGRSIHVLNAPSPAATSCLSIGETIVNQFLIPILD